MFCANCGSKLSDGDIFCRKCGTKIVVDKDSVLPADTKQDISGHLHSRDETAETANKIDVMPPKKKRGMKQLITLAFIAVLAICGILVYKNIGNGRGENLRLDNIVIHEVDGDKGTLYAVFEYNGNMLANKILYSNDGEITEIMEFDERGNISKEAFYSYYPGKGYFVDYAYEYEYEYKDGVVSRRYENTIRYKYEDEFDKFGNLLDIKTYTSYEYILVCDYEYEYNSDGTVNKITEKYLDDNGMEYYWVYQYEYDHDGNVAKEYEYYYDDIHDSLTGSLRACREYEYDRFGNIIKETPLTRTDIVKAWSYWYEYEYVDVSNARLQGSVLEKLNVQNNMTFNDMDMSTESNTSAENAVESNNNLIKVELCYNYRSGENTRTEYEYNADGSIREESKYYIDSNTLDGRREYEYHEGLVIQETDYGINGEAWRRVEYSYDGQGRLILKTDYSYNSTDRTEYEYDGDMTRETRYLEGKSGDDYSERNEYIYGDDGNVIYQKHYFSPDNWWCGEYEYDEKGNKISTHSYDTNGWDGYEYEYEYEYDAVGNMIHRYQNAENIYYDIYYEYDEYGRKAKESQYDYTGDLGIVTEYYY